MDKKKLNRLKLMLVEKKRTGIWLAEQLGVSNTTVSHVTTLKCDNILKPYLAYLSNTRHFHKYAAGCCTGTNIMGLDFGGIERYLMEMPPESLIKRFYDIAITVEDKKSKVILENEHLSNQRNELLPLLMNGQLTIE